jgi:hypothetical protein
MRRAALCVKMSETPLLLAFLDEWHAATIGKEKAKARNQPEATRD